MNKQKDGFVVFVDDKPFSLVSNSRRALEIAQRLSLARDSVQVLSLDSKEKIFIFKRGKFNKEVDR